MSIILRINKYHIDMSVKHTLIVYVCVYTYTCVDKKSWPVVYVCISESIPIATMWQNCRNFLLYILCVFQFLNEHVEPFYKKKNIVKHTHACSLLTTKKAASQEEHRNCKCYLGSGQTDHKNWFPMPPPWSPLKHKLFWDKMIYAISELTAMV